MKKIIPIGIFVLATNVVKAQAIPTSTNEIEAAKVKSHSNANNNRQESSVPKVGAGTQPAGEVGTKRKLNVGKFLKKK